MTEDTPLYSSRIIKTYIDYLRKYYPDIPISELLDYAGVTIPEVEDGGHWFNRTQLDQFHEILTQKTNNPNISREVGRYTHSSESFGFIRQYGMGFLNAPLAYSLIEKFAENITKATDFKTKRLGPHTVEFLAIPKPGIQESPYTCENRIGMLEAISKFYTKQFATIDHPDCIHQGGECCRYIISLKHLSTHKWKILNRYLFLGCALFAVGSFFIFPPTLWAELLFFPTLLISGVTLFTKHLEKKDLLAAITSQSQDAQQALEQVNFRYNGALLIQEIGQAISMILDIDGLLKYIMEALEKRLDFNRGMIMMADREKKRLTFSVGYGYSPEENDFLSKLSFRLDNPHSKGSCCFNL